MIVPPKKVERSIAQKPFAEWSEKDLIALGCLRETWVSVLDKNQRQKYHKKVCNSRFSSECPSCASIRRGDFQAYMSAGVAEATPDEYLVFANVTVPANAGPIIFTAKKKVSAYDRRNQSQPYEVEEVTSSANDGSPRYPSTYDYRRHIYTARLFMDLVSRQHLYLAREFNGGNQIPHAGAVEFHKSALPHLHELVRVPRVDPKTGEVISPAELERRITEVICSAYIDYETTDPETGEVFSIRLQSKPKGIRVVVIEPGDHVQLSHAAGLIRYASKMINYSAKDIGQRFGPSPSRARTRHFQRIEQAIREEQAYERRTIQDESKRLFKKPSMKQFGYNGNGFKSSRNWADLDLTTQRKNRVRWHKKLPPLTRSEMKALEQPVQIDFTDRVDAARPTAASEGPEPRNAGRRTTLRESRASGSTSSLPNNAKNWEELMAFRRGVDQE